MTLREIPATEPVASGDAVVGRTLRQIAWSRLRKDRVAVVSMFVLGFITFIAIFGPLISKWLGVNPFDFNTDLLNDAGSMPIGAFGGVSLDHPLGVEPLKIISVSPFMFKSSVAENSCSDK